MAESSLIVRISADISGLDKATSGAVRRISGLANELNNIGTRLTAGLALPLLAGAGAAVQAAGKMEQSQTAFTTLLGSGQKAAAMLRDLQAFALRTPFEFAGLQDSAKRLMALGFTAREVIPTLTSVGDAVSALGGSSEMIDRVTLALGQMKAKGAVQAEEMRQLAEAGIPAWLFLAKTLKTDIPGAMKQVEARTVDSAKAIAGIIAGINENFGGSMANQSRTLLGLISNLKDQVFKTLSEIGSTILPVAKGIINDAITPALMKVSELAKTFAELPQPIQTFTLSLAGLAAAIGPLAIGAGFAANALSNLTTVAIRAGAALGIASAGAAATAAGYAALAVGVLAAAYEFSRFIGHVVRAINSSIEFRDAVLLMHGPLGMVVKHLELMTGKKFKIDLSILGMAPLRLLNNILDNIQYTKELFEKPNVRAKADVEGSVESIKEQAARLFKDPTTLSGAIFTLAIKGTQELNDKLAQAKIALDTIKKSGDMRLITEATLAYQKLWNELHQQLSRTATLQELVLISQHERGQDAIKKTVAELARYRDISASFGDKIQTITIAPISTAPLSMVGKAIAGIGGEANLAARMLAVLNFSVGGFGANMQQAAREAAAGLRDQVAAFNALDNQLEAGRGLTALRAQVFGTLEGFQMVQSAMRGLAEMQAQIKGANAEVVAAFAELGVKPQRELRRLADLAIQNYDRIVTDAQSTAFDISRSWAAMIEAQIVAGEQLPKAVIRQYEQIKAADPLKATAAKWREFGNQVSTIITDASRGLTNILFGGGSVDTSKLRKVAEQAKLAFEQVRDAAVEQSRDVIAARQRVTDAEQRLASLDARASSSARARLEAEAKSARDNYDAVVKAAQSTVLSTDNVRAALDRMTKAEREALDPGPWTRMQSAAVKALDEIGQAIVRNLIEKFILTETRMKALNDGIEKLAKKLLSVFGVGGAIKLPGIGGTAPTFPLPTGLPSGVPSQGLPPIFQPTFPGPPSSIPSIPGSGAGAGSAASGAAGIANLVTGAVSAVSAVIGNFQMAHMNTALGRIEESTRYVKILTEQTIVPALLTYLPVLNSINDRLITMVTQGVGVYNASGDAGLRMVGAGAGGSSITLNVYAQSNDGKELAQTIMSELKRSGLKLP